MTRTVPCLSRYCLNRQFFIKLQGEKRSARAATIGKLKNGSPIETNEPLGRHAHSFSDRTNPVFGSLSQ